MTTKSNKGKNGAENAAAMEGNLSDNEVMIAPEDSKLGTETLLDGTDADNLFKAIDTSNKGTISAEQLWKALEKQGIRKDDPRMQMVNELLAEVVETRGDQNMIRADLRKIVEHNNVIRKALTGQLTVPDFESFTDDIKEIFNATKSNTAGHVADYIPQLARVNPEHYAVSICTVDGQRFDIGDADVNFCLQSTCKPINYCIAHEELGTEMVHKHIGREPSGRTFNELSLNKDGLPHNPLINAGAIMCCSLIEREQDISDRFDKVLKTWEQLAGGRRPGFNNSVYLSERQTADRNFALAYFMRENKAFPENADIIETLEFYFQCCSIELNADMMAVTAATLANSGINPLTGQRIFSSDTIQNCLSLMYSCGMYDFSGEFAFKIGLPAKSGVSGALMVVIPKVMGICIWSPRLDQHGNSVRGIDFCNALVERYNFHNYDTVVDKSSKKDPRLKKYESKVNEMMSLIWAATYGDLQEILRLEASGTDLNLKDYDGRSALHLAAAEGQVEIVKFLIDRGVELNPKDRWGGTPLEDAYKHEHQHVIDVLELRGATR